MAAFDTTPFVAKGGPAALAVLMRLLETLRDKGVLTSDECTQILEGAAHVQGGAKSGHRGGGNLGH